MHTRSALVKSIAAAVFYTAALIFDLSVLFAQADFDQSNKILTSILLFIIAVFSTGFIIGGLYKGRVYVLARFRTWGFEYRTSSPVSFYTAIIYRSLAAVLAIGGLIMIYN